ncbi:MAG: hypothetical protein AB7J40_03665 [Candidatus Altimarinota bacterium]
MKLRRDQKTDGEKDRKKDESVKERKHRRRIKRKKEWGATHLGYDSSAICDQRTESGSHMRNRCRAKEEKQGSGTVRKK